MRAFLSTFALLISLSTTAIGGPKEEALQVVEKWTNAFTGSDVDGIVKLYAADAVMIGTGSKALIASQEGIRKYFDDVFRSGKYTPALGEHSVLQISDTAVVVTGFDTIVGVRADKPVNLAGRDTFVITKRDAAWQIVHFHRSATPN
ncbi:MAG: SgcJ/EcaC family oxidoreductase [bacterium]|nr:SgcJ/EcaC family oxidoreductase [bacterium]